MVYSEAMGAISLLKLPADHEHCEHPWCMATRRIAEALCRICGKPNGYRVAIYPYPTRLGHAECIDAAYQQALHAFIEDLAELAADQFANGVYPGPSRLAGPSETGGPCKGRCKHPQCAEHRALARTKCFTCQRALGYLRPNVFRKEGYAHADCVNELSKEVLVSTVELREKPPPGAPLSHTMMLPEFDIDVSIPLRSRKYPGTVYRATAQIGGPPAKAAQFPTPRESS